MRALLAAIMLLTPSLAMAAGEINLSCQHYQSKCSASACYSAAEKFALDTDRELLKNPNIEKTFYIITADHAQAMFEATAAGASTIQGKYTLDFKYVTHAKDSITLENKLDDGTVKERVIIDKKTGFYIKYMLSTDKSLKDVPVGYPFYAYFGWCDFLPGGAQ